VEPEEVLQASNRGIEFDMGTTPNVLFPWGKEYQVGIRFVDIQHEQLADIINWLHQAIVAGKGKQVVGKALEELILYAQAHFTEEEKVLESCGYPEFKALHGENECLTYAVLEFHQKLMSNQLRLSGTVMDFLKDWLGEHMQSVDTKCVPFLKDKGVT
jgi:hemerythrin-like metal-binding protein